MSTRCNIHFSNGKYLAANIYRHSDGYPGEVKNGEETEYGVLSDLLKFFRLLKAEVPDSRFGDAHYLSAKFLVWQSQELTQYARIYNPYKGPKDEDGYGPTHYLQFLSVCPMMRDAGDAEYIYDVNCDKVDAEGFPVIRWKSNHKGSRYRTVYLCGKPTAKAANAA
jgi:hypothetical protein